MAFSHSKVISSTPALALGGMGTLTVSGIQTSAPVVRGKKAAKPREMSRKVFITFLLDDLDKGAFFGGGECTRRCLKLKTSPQKVQ
jgi:hypothetical protein